MSLTNYRVTSIEIKHSDWFLPSDVTIISQLKRSISGKLGYTMEYTILYFVDDIGSKRLFTLIGR